MVTSLSEEYPINESYDRCPGCMEWITHIRAIGIYTHLLTGQSFGYTLCNTCTERLLIDPIAVIRNVEAYFSEEIAKMNDKSTNPQWLVIS